ncbi:beta-glucosidase family protein [Saccharopolyspora sp. CA-218241]|uniref:beta-glucosidase family protein n=1 Tax=Saccharopolyspora sp. CA-218241 TaxID=3240027 RepID=UPI003D9828B9
MAGTFADLVDRLDLERKVELLTGQDFWSTVPIESIGLRSVVLSDGPVGVRGPRWDEREPSLNLPSATALAAAWDRELARAWGAVAAAEARRKGVDVVLGPTINLHRSPLGGRHFEAFSEDPVLTADLAAAVVTGLQDNGVAATPKHYVANDFETDRFTVDVRVDDRALRELYLLAFEKAVVESRAWAVMSAYNSINGTTATEHDLLTAPLNEEWGFDGVVVSDWTAVRSLGSARAAQDLVMPGPSGPWGQRLVDAVRAGEVPEAAVDRKVERILRLAARVGALDGYEAPAAEPVGPERAREFVRSAAVAGTVLVRNTGLLPLGPVRRIAVIGHGATQARTQGGGSATVVPDRVVSPLEGVRAAFPDARVDHALGAVVQQGVGAIPVAELTNPVTGEPGVHLSLLDEAGAELRAEERFATEYVWLGGDSAIDRTARLRASTTWTPTTSGVVHLGFAAVGRTALRVDGAVLLDERAEVAADQQLGAAFLAPPSATAPVELVAGEPLRIEIEHDRGPDAMPGVLTFAFGTAPADDDPEGLIAEAAELAAEADAVVLVVGTHSRVESEGFDRTDLRLPGRQDELARAVLAANPRTVAVVNSGAPVELPWRDEAAAVLLTWFGGQEFGNALGDVLGGAAEPGGRLPTTWPAAAADVPVLSVTPEDGVVRYDEGIHLGYRAWLRAGAEPAYPFGFGLGYTTWELTGCELPGEVAAGDGLTARIALRNTGERTGKQVVQVYAARPGSAVDRPVRWLVGFAAVTAAPGEEVTAEVAIPGRAFAHWDAGWRWERGEYVLSAGTSVRDLPLSATVQVR